MLISETWRAGEGKVNIVLSAHPDFSNTCQLYLLTRNHVMEESCLIANRPGINQHHSPVGGEVSMAIISSWDG